VKKNFQLRQEVEAKLKKIYQQVFLERAASGSSSFEESLLASGQTLELDEETDNLRGIEILRYGFRIAGERFGYGFFSSTSFLDSAILLLEEIFPVLIELAELEKTVALLAEEIEKTRRRVNALEYILIPDLKQAIYFIVAKLDQLERSSFVTLLKMKELVKK
jgi:V/A-type H+-transporting ATPase subunit D